MLDPQRAYHPSVSAAAAAAAGAPAAAAVAAANGWLAANGGPLVPVPANGASAAAAHDAKKARRYVPERAAGVAAAGFVPLSGARRKRFALGARADTS